MRKILYTNDPATLERQQGAQYRDAIHLLIIAGAITLLILVLAILLTQVTVFEDGSFGFGVFPYWLKGCIPGALCNLK